jgi:glycosyltransferase involved in cell wall biosynthesis
MASRWRARSLAAINDDEAFKRPQPAYFHDRFGNSESEKPRVLFVSPYPICPPTHGGGLFMYNTLRELSRTCEVHAIVMLDWPEEREAHQELLNWCRTVELFVRTADRTPHLASTEPNAVREFHRPEIEWLIQRNTLLHRIDVIQLEYTHLAQYARKFENIVCAVFEHDVYFQSVASALPFIQGSLDRIKARFEYMRAIRFELGKLPDCDHIQVCTEDNRRYLTSFLPSLAPRIDAGLRAGIDTGLYAYPGGPRQPFTMLFLGSFRHTPNKVALDWFSKEVLPLIVAKVPQARLQVAGAEPPLRHSFSDPANAVDLLGFVDNIQPLFAGCALFVCPIRSGSGIRVKLLEAFASGIPVVSTRLGAEGLAKEDGEFCALADDPAVFAARVVELLLDSERAAQMAARARREVETNWDAAIITDRLVEKYRDLLETKRRAILPAGEPVSSQSAPLRD